MRFAIAAKGIPATRIAAILGVQHKHAWALLHKLRDTLNRNKDLSPLNGEVHIDGGYFNYYIRPKNFKHKRIDRRAKRNQRQDKSCVLVFRQKSADYHEIKGADRTIVAQIKEENTQDMLALTRLLVKQDSEICADENPAYDALGFRYKLYRVNHSQEYRAIDGTTNNLAESYFARLRRASIGVYHRMLHNYLMLYANEIAWREDTRKQKPVERLEGLLCSCLNQRPSPHFTCYGQGNRKPNTKLGVESLIACNEHLDLLKVA